MHDIEISRSEAEKLVILIDCYADPQDREMTELGAYLRQNFGMVMKAREEAYRDGTVDKLTE